jgi:hypothetical protein
MLLRTAFHFRKRWQLAFCKHRVSTGPRSSEVADDTKRDAADVRKEIDGILQANTSAPFGGLAGEKLVNVLEVNWRFASITACLNSVLLGDALSRN